MNRTLLLTVLFVIFALASAQRPYSQFYEQYYGRSFPAYRQYYDDYYQRYYNQPTSDIFHHLGRQVRRSSHTDRYGGNHH